MIGAILYGALIPGLIFLVHLVSKSFDWLRQAFIVCFCVSGLYLVPSQFCALKDFSFVTLKVFHFATQEKVQCPWTGEAAVASV